MLERLGMTMDACAAVGWGEVLNWARHLPPDSATMRELDPELGAWATRYKTNAMLASAIDGINELGYIVAKSRGANLQKPKPYPRPGSREKSSLGKGAIPISEFDEWWNSGER